MSWGSTAPLLADTSAWARAAAYPDPWLEAHASGQLVICVVVQLELLYSARTPEEVEQLDADLGLYRDLPVTRGTLAATRRAIVELSTRGSDGHHRVPFQDAIIAACAAEHGCAVLHYDAHYDRLAEVLDFESLWAAPPGSL